MVKKAARAEIRIQVDAFGARCKKLMLRVGEVGMEKAVEEALAIDAATPADLDFHTFCRGLLTGEVADDRDEDRAARDVASRRRAGDYDHA